MTNYKLMTHIVAGYPDLKTSEQIARTLIENGTDYLEIQLPFTDPVADGPVISQANHAALEGGFKLQQGFELMQRLRANTNIPLYFMTYYNVAFANGIDGFCAQAKAAGATGLIIPDIPYDEEAHSHYLATCAKYDLNPVLVVSPLTPEDRLKAIGKKSKGLLYAVAQAGTTGSSDQTKADLGPYFERLRQHTDLPIALGFGISSRADMDAAGSHADIVVVGSQLIREYGSGGLDALKQFLSN